MRVLLRSLVFAICCLAAVGITPTAFAQSTPDGIGDWHGMLRTPRGELTLIVSIARAPDGSLTGTLESPDQASGKIPETAVKVEGDRLSFDVPAIGASFEGHWVAGEQAWDGVFAQGTELPLKLTQGLPPARPTITGLDGAWAGKVNRSGVELHFVLRVMTNKRGTLASFDSPDQLAYGVGVEGFTRDGSKIRFEVALVGAEFDGTLSDDGQHLIGSWKVPNRPLVQIDFARQSEGAVNAGPKRPQTPRPPFPYRSEEVGFDNAQAPGVHLAGTLTLPAGKGPFPTAIMITGSGQQDRDETILGHKPFWVIADYLSRRGIAVLRVDDRGTGKSTGDVANATSADFATDANAAFAYLRTRKDIRPDAIGFIGHSEGGMIGPIAMAINKQVAFLIMMAGPGTALDQLMVSQRRLISAGMGQSEAEIDRATPVWAALFKAFKSGATFDEGRAAALAVLTPDAMEAIGAPRNTDRQTVISQIATPWFRYFFTYDPAPNLRAIMVPVLAVGGSLDRQVPPVENLAAIRAALKDNKNATIVEMPGLNHMFQTARTGGVGEYAAIEETVAPAALEKMASWIIAHFPTS